eukprot:scaffold7740_cov112-Isochrysis_galbana.AAC.14
MALVDFSSASHHSPPSTSRPRHRRQRRAWPPSPFSPFPPDPHTHTRSSLALEAAGAPPLRRPLRSAHALKTGRAPRWS